MALVSSPYDARDRLGDLELNNFGPVGAPTSSNAQGVAEAIGTGTLIVVDLSKFRMSDNVVLYECTFVLGHCKYAMQREGRRWYLSFYLQV